jgi:hypothetical protein
MEGPESYDRPDTVASSGLPVANHSPIDEKQKRMDLVEDDPDSADRLLVYTTHTLLR